MENSKEKGKKKVSNEELENVVGGGCGRSLDPHKNRHCITRMLCRACDYIIWYRGDWMDSQYHKCPNCGKMELRGIWTKSQDWR